MPTDGVSAIKLPNFPSAERLGDTWRLGLITGASGATCQIATCHKPIRGAAAALVVVTPSTWHRCGQISAARRSLRRVGTAAVAASHHDRRALRRGARAEKFAGIRRGVSVRRRGTGWDACREGRAVVKRGTRAGHHHNSSSRQPLIHICIHYVTCRPT